MDKEKDSVSKWWGYYRKVACAEGMRREEPPEGSRKYWQAPTSVWWFFAEVERQGLDRLNPLTRAFLGSREAMEELKPEPVELAEGTVGQAPNACQREAIRRALEEPLSLIQGPPGTGKTETILNLLYQIDQLGRTAAVLSSNGEALRTIHKKLQELPEAQLAERVAQLGNGKVREPALSTFRASGKECVERLCYLAESWDGPVTCLEQKEGDERWETASQDRRPEDPRESCPMKQDISREGVVTVSQFLKKYPIFTSTIHSLPNCLRDGLLYQYDYVIVDETSQLDPFHGLIAMSHARHLVLVGDEEQLPPVLSDQVAQAAREIFASSAEVDASLLEGEQAGPELDFVPEGDFLWSCYKEHPELFEETGPEEAEVWEEEQAYWKTYGRMVDTYAVRQNRSFLDACKRAFLDPEDPDGNKNPQGRIIKTFLKDHYRCHPGIIQFCNEEVYQGRLEVHTPQRGVLVPIKFLWFDGDYCEPCFAGEENGRENRRKRGKRNQKQLTIFLREEWPELSRRLREDESLRVGILVPFVVERDMLEKELQRREEAYLAEHPGARRLLKPMGEKEQEPEADGEEPEPPCQVLTVHKAQGKGYDIVYLLGVEDGYWNWPWSQQKRMVNVVVSRAKRELRIVTSAKYMSPKVRRELGLPVYQENEPDQENLFLQKLADYVQRKLRKAEEAGVAGDYPDQVQFGFHRSRLVSLFDEKQGYQLQNKAQGKQEDFAPEQCMWKALEQIRGESPLGLNIRLEREVPIRQALEPFRGDRPLEEDKFYGNNWSRFDFALFRESGELLLAIEVDGVDHRFPWLKEVEGETESPYEAWVERCQNYRRKDEIVQSLGGDVYHGNQKEGSEGQWGKPEGKFALLRLPDDGTAYLETDALRKQYGDQGTGEEIFTVEDLIRKYAGLSLSRTIELWRQEEPEGAGGVFLKLLEEAEKPGRPVRQIQERMIQLGYLERRKEGCLPTERGRKAGIRALWAGTETPGERGKCYPVYPREARSAIGQILNGQVDDPE